MSPYLSSVQQSNDEVRQTDVKAVFPHIDVDPADLSGSLDPFTITTSTGFLPLRTPLVDLPPAFHAVTALVERMPIVKEDGSPGLLATYQLGPTIDRGDALPNLTAEIDKLLTADDQPDLFTVTAVFREYSFLASAYLLEPCYERTNSGLEGYGLGRKVLPKCLAGPLVKTAKM